MIDLHTHASITVNATCGDPLTERFCPLSEHVQSRLTGSVQCQVCEPGSHSIRYTINTDNSNWWQSPTMAHGRSLNWVTVTIDLKNVS